MKHIVGMIAAVAMLAAGAWAAEPGDGKGPPSIEEMQHHEKALEIKAREMKIDFEQKRMELELEQRRVEIEGMRQHEDNGHGEKEGLGALLLLLIVVNHILVTVWVCKDMREQKIGRALWVPIVLLSGVLGAILYAIVRVADTRTKPTGTEAKAK